MNATNYKRKAPSSTFTRNTSARNDAEAKITTYTTVKSGSSPTTLQINNVAIHFPFKPYDVQTNYMKCVLDALQRGEHALLESPTGTGKTLCLLCSTLAWQQAQKGLNNKIEAKNTINDNQSSANNRGQAKTPVIIYASRTHSQLSQVVREMKNTRYRPRHAVLGSREHMCIHPKINPLVASRSKNNKPPPTSTDVNHACNKLNKERKCIYRNTLDEHGTGWHPPYSDQEAGDDKQPIRDMEDLVSAGKQHKICPFYYTRGLISQADIIFVPYNYLFDRDARESTLAEVDFANSILIFDEAHNLEEFASESSSFDLCSQDVAGCVGEVQRALQYLELNPDTEEGPKLKDNILRLKSIFLKLEQFLLDELSTKIEKKASPTGDSSHSGEFIFDIFREGAGISHANSGIFISFVRQVQDLIMECKGNINSSATPKLDHFVNCLKRVYGSGTEMLALARSKSYRVHVTKVNANTGGGFAGGRTISYWCFAPALAMRELASLKVRSILITSGTLSPLPSFAIELGLEFPIQLENQHVIEPDQIFVRVIGKGVSGKQLSSKYGRRDDPEYILELGNSLASLCRNIQGGCLVFFPSYSTMQLCVERWGGPSREAKPNQNGGQFFAARKKQQSARYSFPQIPAHFMVKGETSTPWNRLLSRKAIVLEPRSTNDLNDAIAEFKKFIHAPKSPGCILMGVCRGKISEGIDFTDNMCRAVIVTGLPFAPYLDPKVKLKRNFLDMARANESTPSGGEGGFGNCEESANKNNKPKTTLSGAEWYNQQAHRAVNQAIGRVIRHRHDYGSVLFLDHRFSETKNREGLSKWLRPHLIDESFGLSTRSMVQFYKDAKAKTELSRVRPVLKYEDPAPRDTSRTVDDEDQVTQITVVSSTIMGEDHDEELDTFIPESRIQKRFDLNEPFKKEKVVLSSNDSFMTIDAEIQKSSANILAEAYRKIKPANVSNTTNEEAPSMWKDLESKTQVSNHPKPKPYSSKASSISIKSRKIDVKQKAKVFFDSVKQLLSGDELFKVQHLLISMKTHGDKKASNEYINTAKRLMSLLSGTDQTDRERIKLISLLFPLLPIKHRYVIEKMGRKLCFEKSILYTQCKSTVSAADIETIQKITPQLMMDENSHIQPSVVDSASHDRSLLEDVYKILLILTKGKINHKHLFDLLPERLLGKARAISIEIAKENAIVGAKERSGKKGETRINPVLFKKSHHNAFVPATNLHQPEETDTENMTAALTQGRALHDEKKKRVVALESRSSFHKHGMLPSKRVTNSDQNKNEDEIDVFLDQVRNNPYQPRLERLNSKIKANVPKNFMCSLCNTTPKEPLRAKCGHSACSSCWKKWLSRQNSCPHCRNQTEMKTMSKVVFNKDGQNNDVGFTQVCENDSDNDELEVMPRL